MINFNEMEMEAVLRNYGDELGVRTAEEFKSLRDKVENRLESVICNNRRLPFIPVSKEEILVLRLAGILTGSGPILSMNGINTYMGFTLKEVVFTFNPYL